MESSGGFNSSGDFNNKYNQYFKSILIEPNTYEIKLKKILQSIMEWKMPKGILYFKK